VKVFTSRTFVSHFLIYLRDNQVRGEDIHPKNVCISFFDMFERQIGSYAKCSAAKQLTRHNPIQKHIHYCRLAIQSRALILFGDQNPVESHGDVPMQ